MITTVTSVQRFATKTLYTRARATDGSTMLAPMSPGTGKGLKLLPIDYPPPKKEHTGAKGEQPQTSCLLRSSAR